MKKYIIYSIALLAGAFFMTSCSEDELDKESIITLDKVDKNPFDEWLEANFVNTYNIEVKYRFEDIESDHNYYVIPAEYNQAIKLAHIVKYACLEAFDEAAGIAFTRANFPKLIYMVGNWEYRNNNTMVLGTAEGGKKIFLAGVNHVNEYTNNREDLNHYYLKTIFHEFTHILNQTKDYSPDYKLITPTTYIAGEWSSDTNNKDTVYLPNGYISGYARHSAGEDFAEMFSIYVTNDQATWDGFLETAGKEGAGWINAKLDLVKSYMRDSWGINMDELREIVLRRENDVANRIVDLTDLSVK
ncbi:MAG: putative zinc-binding metallopeptidase [Prevotella sp.]|nr:putative zinc-binding metallopeptidase [Prevotella sp.]